jgi:protein ImuA
MNKKVSDSVFLPHNLPVAGWGHALAALGPEAKSVSGTGRSLVDVLKALPANAVHEVYAASREDKAVMTGFGVMLALMLSGDTPCFFVRQSCDEATALYPMGLAELGLDPSRCFTVHAPDVLAALRASADIARSSAAGAVLIEVSGNPRLLDLTASRRLALAAEKSGTTVLLLRLGAREAPSAAYSRWQVKPALSTSLLAEAPGSAAFNVMLLRHRRVQSGPAAQLIWNVEERRFDEQTAIEPSPRAGQRTEKAAASGRVVPLVARRTAGPRPRRAA